MTRLAARPAAAAEVLVGAGSGKPRNIPDVVARAFALVPPDEEP